MRLRTRRYRRWTSGELAVLRRIKKVFPEGSFELKHSIWLGSAYIECKEVVDGFNRTLFTISIRNNSVSADVYFTPSPPSWNYREWNYQSKGPLPYRRIGATLASQLRKGYDESANAAHVNLR